MAATQAENQENDVNSDKVQQSDQQLHNVRNSLLQNGTDKSGVRGGGGVVHTKAKSTGGKNEMSTQYRQQDGGGVGAGAGAGTATATPVPTGTSPLPLPLPLPVPQQNIQGVPPTSSSQAPSPATAGPPASQQSPHEPPSIGGPPAGGSSANANANAPAPAAPSATTDPDSSSSGGAGAAASSHTGATAVPSASASASASMDSSMYHPAAGAEAPQPSASDGGHGYGVFPPYGRDVHNSAPPGAQSAQQQEGPGSGGVGGGGASSGSGVGVSGVHAFGPRQTFAGPPGPKQMPRFVTGQPTGPTPTLNELLQRNNNPYMCGTNNYDQYKCWPPQKPYPGPGGPSPGSGPPPSPYRTQSAVRLLHGRPAFLPHFHIPTFPHSRIPPSRHVRFTSSYYNLLGRRMPRAFVCLLSHRKKKKTPIPSTP